MNETPLFINIPTKKTIAKIGSKEVNIKTHGKEKFTLLQYCELLLMALSYHRCLCLKLHQEEELKKEFKNTL